MKTTASTEKQPAIQGAESESVKNDEKPVRVHASTREGAVDTSQSAAALVKVAGVNHFGSCKICNNENADECEV